MTITITITDPVGIDHLLEIEKGSFPTKDDDRLLLFSELLKLDKSLVYELLKKNNNTYVINYQLDKMKKCNDELHSYDVFLCHNSDDKKEILLIYNELKALNITPWLDIKELQPGKSWKKEIQAQVCDIKSAAVFIGNSGFGPWQDVEIDALLQEFVKRDCPVIPVLLSSCDTKPELPPFLSNLTYVDFNYTLSDPLEQLIWGITGKNPNK